MQRIVNMAISSPSKQLSATLYYYMSTKRNNVVKRTKTANYGICYNCNIY
jgi:hypothetical protein